MSADRRGHGKCGSTSAPFSTVVAADKQGTNMYAAAPLCTR